MNGFYQLDIEAFPDNQTIYATLEPTEVDDNASFFSFEIERDEVMLAKMLRKLNAYSDLQTPMPSFRSFSRETLKKNINTCYCQGDNIRDIIELYQNRNITPNKEFPGATAGKTQDEYENEYPGIDQAFFTEHIPLNRDTLINETICKAGSILNLYYRGKL